MVIIAVIAIAALISLARVIFFPATTSTPVEEDTSRVSLLDSSNGHSVRMNVRGPIVADEEFNSYQITVSNNNRNIKTYTGYLDTIVEQINLGNSVPAYEQFVHALDKADLADGVELEGENDDLRGICATGRVYEFFILEGGASVKHLWTSTCNGSRGSLDANVNQVSELFVRQIPDADSLIRQVGL